MKRSDNLTSAQVQEILQLYPDIPTAEIAKRFGKNIWLIYKTAQRYGISKSEAFRNSHKSGRIQPGQRLSQATEFKKGCIPATKGKKLKDIVKSKAALKKSVATRWKKGHKPYNTKFDGAITVRRMRVVGNESIPYKMIRISENNWEFLHRHIWKKEHGNIPTGFNIVFKDGNTLNCTLENLECISNAELADRNRHTKYSPKLRTAIENINKLHKLIKNETDKY